MPVDYWAILKQAYSVTVRYPRLWLLGLFLSGGFNANFLYWANLRLRWRDGSEMILDWVQQNFHTTHVVVAFIGLIAAFIGIVVLANWVKVIFVLETSNILKLKRMEGSTAQSGSKPLPVLQESQRFVPTVTAMSIFTLISTVVVVSLLGSSTQLLFQSRGLVWLVAAIALLGLVFFFSSLNIFATFFIVFYRQGFGPALNLSLDLIVSRKLAIIEMAIILVLVYSLCFFVGTSVTFIFRFGALQVLTPLLSHELVSAPVFFGLVTGASGLLLWMWLAIVNVFFNLSLLLLFTHLVQPPYHPEFQSLLERFSVIEPHGAHS